jgi:hypothetical protein
MRGQLVKIPTEPPDRGWLERARQCGWTARTGDAVWRPLKRILLGIGGWSVCLPSREPDLEAIVSRGQRFPGEAELIEGEPCRCHANSAQLSLELPGSRIVTGYALSDDGMWRQHSWVLVGERLVETTEHREQYFGVVLSDGEAEEFRRWNL